MEGLDALFNPSSVAVVGASSTPGKVGHDIFVNILKGGFTGTLYPVNPKAKSIASVRAYPDIQDIPDSIDLAIIILPPRFAETAIAHAIDKGVKAVVIVSAGFKEVGGEGLEIERRIVDMCREAGVRVVGPNCLGVINPNADVQLNAVSHPECRRRGTFLLFPKVAPCVPRYWILRRTKTLVFPNLFPLVTKPMWMNWICCAIFTPIRKPK